MNKKFPKFLAVSLLAAFGVVACDDIEARPNKNGNGDDVQVIKFKDVDVYGNNYQSVNDNIHGTITEATLDSLLNTYATRMVGAFNRNAAKIYAKKITINGQEIDGNTLVTLEDVVYDQSKVTDFVKEYKIYEVLKEDGTHDTAKEYEYIKARYENIQNAINTKMFLKLKSAVTNYKFDEQAYLQSLYIAGSKVQNPYKLADVPYTKDLVLVPEIEVEDIFTYPVLHKEHYSSDTNTYIEDEILPEIYSDLLTQQYILEKQDSILGSSYARKVNYVAIPYGDIDNALYAKQLVEGFVTKYLLTSNTTDIKDAFKLLSSTWNGAFMGENNIEQSAEWNLLKTVGLVDRLTVGGIVKQTEGKYYLDGSAYGTLVEDYAKWDVNPRKSINTEDYTNSNTHVKEIGFQLDQTQISLKDYTGSGWYVKANDTSNLSASVQERLYNLLVASGINNETSSVLTKDNEGVWSDTETNKFVTKFTYDNNNEAYFLRTGSRKVNEEAYQDIIFNDTSSNSYYIVNVEEAVSPNYMKNCTDYATKLSVLELLSTSDSYVDLATKYWLEKCDIQYHDQSVYDYFEENYPELFEDD